MSMAKNAFHRLINKASVSDDGYENEYFDDEYVEEEEYVEDDQYDDVAAEVTPIRSVAPVPDIARIITVWPKSIDGGTEFADPYRNGIPVILNLSAAGNADRRRILDFAAGVCYGLHGKLNKISNDVFLLTPQKVTVEASNAQEIDKF